MERKKFIQSCAFACLAGAGLTAVLQSCTGTKMVTGNISGSDIIIPVASFANGDNKFKKYLVVQNDQLQYPICLYRFSETEYSALLMKCTHQGAELQVFGDVLQCPAHGSEFNNKGVVQNPPADTNLRTFPVTVQNNEIKISLQ